DRAAAHAVADKMIVQAVSAEHAFLAEMAKFGIANRAGRAAVIHGMAPDAVGVRRFHDDVAAEVGDLAAVLADREMLELQRLVKRDLVASNGSDRALLGVRRVLG